MITNTQSGTNIHEIAPGVYRINTPAAAARRLGVQLQSVPDRGRRAEAVPHGPKEAVPARQRGVHPAPCCPSSGSSTSRYRTSKPTNAARSTSFSSPAPHAVPILRPGGRDGRDRRLRGTARRARSRTARNWRSVHAPSSGSTRRTVPHAWECGLMLLRRRRGRSSAAISSRKAAPARSRMTEADILGPSEAFRKPMDYFAHAPSTRAVLERIAREAPTTLAVHARQRLARRRRARCCASSPRCSGIRCTRSRRSLG